MIQFYTWATPNGTKVAAMLEECELSYQIKPVNLGKGEQRSRQFLSLNPNGKIPVLADHDAHGTSLMLSESAAIMLYLAEKRGVLLPPDATARQDMMQWIMFQMSSVGPAFGQLHHFESSASERAPYALQRFEAESRRLLGVLEGRLAVRQWLAGMQYSVADVCTWPWIRSWQITIKKDLGGFPNVQRWYEECAARSASKAAIKLYDALKAGAPV